MRVNRSSEDQRGAVAVIVAIMCLVLFGAAAYAIDAGNLWQTRRNMVTASDAAALAAAGEYAVGQNGCANASEWLTTNRSDATLDSCTPSGTNNGGHVTVSGHTTVPFSFAGVFGLTDEQVTAATSARWGIASSASGLRPIALCITATPELQEWLNLPAGPTGPTTTPIKIMLSNSQPDACVNESNQAAGNWGLAFGEGNNSNSDTVDWLLNGYDDEVSVGDDVHANPGAFSNSVNSALQTLRDNDVWFPLPVFDRVVGKNGSNASYHIVSFVFVQLVDFVTTGAETDRYITVNMDRGVIEGSCCGTGLDTGTRVVRICDVDALEPDTSDDAC
jgi:hypothetical protein